MSVQTLPTSGLSLHGAPPKVSRDQNKSTIARSAIVVRLNEQVIKGLQQCSRDGKALRVLGGKIPKLQYGNKSTELIVSSETFHHELYTSAGNALDLSFRTLVSQFAEVKPEVARPVDDISGSDEALANLKQSLASFAQEKEAKKATISSGIIANSKNNKSLSAGRHFPASSQGSSRLGSPSGSQAPNQRLAPTSAPSHPQEAAEIIAMDRVILHLLAVKPLKEQEVSSLTHIPLNKCLERLNKIADPTKNPQEWELKSKSYKDLNVWKFKYRIQDDRQKAIDNAVRSFDRLRLPKDDKLWQMLLPEEERGKGKILSRLHSAAVTGANRERASPHLSGRSPLPAGEATNNAKKQDLDAKPSTSTPRMGALDMKKKLNQAKKQREAEEAKQKKRMEKEAVPLDREAKPRAKAAAPVKQPASKVKSAETVKGSDEEEGGSVRGRDSVLERGTARGLGNTKSSPEKLAAGRTAPTKSPLPSERSNPRKVASDRPTTTKLNDTPADSRPNESKVTRKPGSALPVSQNAATPRLQSATPSTTPSGRSEKHQPAPSSRQVQLSPRKPDNKPKVPSPLGAARPRQASDASSLRNERSPAPSVRSSKTTNSVRDAAKTEKPSTPAHDAKNTAVSKKRPLGDSGDETARPTKSAKTSAPSETSKLAQKPATQKLVTAHQTSTTSDTSLKRKANDVSSGIHDHNVAPQTKHRRTDSTSTHSAKYSSGSSNSGSQTTTAQTSIASPSWERSPSNASSTSEGARLSWEKALAEAEAFQNQYYPKYIELYERLSALPPGEIKVEDRKKLMHMHERLAQMKRDIRSASR